MQLEEQVVLLRAAQSEALSRVADLERRLKATEAQRDEAQHQHNVLLRQRLVKVAPPERRVSEIRVGRS